MAGKPMSLGTMIMLFIGILIGIILFSALADPIWETRNTYTTPNATTNIGGNLLANGNMTEGTTIVLADNYLKSLTVSTGNGTALTLDTDYTTSELNSQTVTTITLKDSEIWAGSQGGVTNDTRAEYTHGDNYVEDSVSRTFLNLILIFFVIGIIAFVIAKLNDVFQFIDTGG